ncbi:hypothetical protein D3C84_373420 [compost metagenome]
MLLQPRQVEHFATGAFGALAGEERVAQQRPQQCWCDAAAGRPVAVAIIAKALAGMDPGIEQHVAGAAIEAAHRLVGFDQAEVAEATHVQHRQAFALCFEECLMEGRNQRCALAACGYIATSEITDDGDAGQLGEQRRIADLHGKAARGLMTDSLAVTANGANGRWAEVFLRQELIDSACRQGGPVLFGNGRPGNFIRAAGAQVQQLGAHVVRHWDV